MTKNRPAVSRPRSRSFGSFIAVDHRSRGGDERNHSLSSPAYNFYSPGITQRGTRKECYDFVTKGWRQVLKQGGRINNPAVITTDKRECYTQSYRRSWLIPGSSPPTNGWELSEGAAVAYVFGDLATRLASTPTPIDTAAHNRAATIQALSRVEPSQTQAWVTALESHESVRMILNRTRQLVEIVSACRRLDADGVLKAIGRYTKKRPHPRRYAVWDEDGYPILNRRGSPKRTYGHLPKMSSDPNLLDQASLLWLEYRFGWSPLVHDMVNALKALHAADLRGELLPRPVKVARGESSQTLDARSSLSSTTQGLTYQGQQDVTWSYQVKAWVHYRPDASDGVLRRMNDFGLFDIPGSLWEIVPFSFIVDRFIPIGEWLSALTPKVGVEVLDQGHVMVSGISASQTLTGPATQVVGGTTYPSIAPVGSRDTWEFRRMERKPFLQVPLKPSVQVQLSLKGFTDIVALLRQHR